MNNIYVVEYIDMSCGEGYSYTLCAFPNVLEANLFKDKIEKVFDYLRERADKYQEKHPECYIEALLDRYLKVLQKNPEFKYLIDIPFGYYSNDFVDINIIEVQLFSDYYDYIGSK